MWLANRLFLKVINDESKCTTYCAWFKMFEKVYPVFYTTFPYQTDKGLSFSKQEGNLIWKVIRNESHKQGSKCLKKEANDMFPYKN